MAVEVQGLFSGINEVSPHPATQHLPIPCATTAAWEVMRTASLSIPLAACIPPISSGLTSGRARITFSPQRPFFGILLKDHPADSGAGEAGKPFATGQSLALGSIIGCNNYVQLFRLDSEDGGFRQSNLPSTYLNGDAYSGRPGPLTARPCNIYNFLSWIVNLHVLHLAVGF